MRNARIKKTDTPDNVRRWGRKLLYHLRWNAHGPRGGAITFDNLVMLSGLTSQKIESVLYHDVHTGRFEKWTQQGTSFLRARKSRLATDSSEPQVEETVHGSQCLICYEDLTNLDVTTTLCNHKFCAQCAWFMGSRCAYCRRDRPLNMYHDTTNVPMDFTSAGFDSFEVDSSSDDEEFTQRRLDELFRGLPPQMLQSECPYCHTSWTGWNCLYCRRTHC